MKEKITAFFSRFSKQQLFLFAALIVFAVLFCIQIVFIYSTKGNVSRPDSLVSPPTTDQNNLAVILTKPEHGRQDVSLNEPIVISFNRQLNPEEISFTLFPAILTTSEIQENNLIVTPRLNYAPGTTYTFIIRYPRSNKLPDSYSFTATGPTAVLQPDTQPTGASEREDNFQKANNPDVFLSNQVPFETDMFSIESDYASDPSGHFYFLVTLKGPNDDGARGAALEWMKSLGLTDDQIQQLDIRYSYQ